MFHEFRTLMSRNILIYADDFFFLSSALRKMNEIRDLSLFWGYEIYFFIVARTFHIQFFKKQADESEMKREGGGGES